MLIASGTSGSSGHIDVSTETSEDIAGIGAGDYAYVDRSL